MSRKDEKFVKDDVNDIREWLGTQGALFELDMARKLVDRQAHVTLGDSFLDSQELEIRATDIHATWTLENPSPHPALHTLHLIVECKSTNASVILCTNRQMKYSSINCYSGGPETPSCTRCRSLFDATTHLVPLHPDGGFDVAYTVTNKQDKGGSYSPAYNGMRAALDAALAHHQNLRQWIDVPYFDEADEPIDIHRGATLVGQRS